MTRIPIRLSLALIGIVLVVLGFTSAHPAGLALIAVGVTVGAPALLFFLAEVST